MIDVVLLSGMNGLERTETIGIERVKLKCLHK
jgi:hypothetical protein